MRPLLDERKQNCGMRKAVENGFPREGRVITGLKAGVNEKTDSLINGGVPFINTGFQAGAAYPESAKPF